MDFKGKLSSTKTIIKGYGTDYGSSSKLLDIQKAFGDISPAENHRKINMGHTEGTILW